MFKLQSKDHLVYFMQCGLVRLSKNDLKFIQNIHLLIAQGNPITTNQVRLFEKLVLKYNRQLNKQGIIESVTQGLQWNCKIVPSEPIFTDTFISVDDQKIYIKTPYNKNFIKAFREAKLNTYKWNKEHKRYESDFSTVSLKLAIDTTHKFFTEINYCPVTVELLNTVCNYNENDIWEPTLVRKNNNLYVLAINEYLYEAIKDIPLTTTTHTLDLLSRYGIKVDQSVTKNNKKLEFMSSFAVTKDISELDDIVEWLVELKCTDVYFSGVGALTNKAKSELIDRLKKLLIRTQPNSDADISKTENSYGVVFQLGTMSSSTMMSVYNKNYIMKIIHLKNSTPVEIK